jgi:hypothetical protein
MAHATLTGPVKLTRQKNFRLTAREEKGIEREAQAVGLTDSQWLRLVVRAALGETRLLEQLSRVAPRRKARRAKKR